MNFSEALDIASSIIISIGGSLLIVISLSSWLGKIWANRIMDKERVKWDKELESYKQQLEKSKKMIDNNEEFDEEYLKGFKLVVDDNIKNKTMYDTLLEEISEEFKKQISVVQ